MRRSLLCAASLLAAAGSLAADQAKNAPPTSLRTPPPVANVPTYQGLLDTSLTVDGATGFIGSWLPIHIQVSLDHGKTAPWVGWNHTEPVKIEVSTDFGGTRIETIEIGTNFWFKVPALAYRQTGILKARVLRSGRQKESDWAYCPYSLDKGPTALAAVRKPVALPPAYALVKDVTVAEEVTATLTTSLPVDRIRYSLSTTPDPKNTAIPGRPVVVNVQGGVVFGQVPPTDGNGKTTFLLIHQIQAKPVVQVAFMGDDRYEPSGTTLP